MPTPISLLPNLATLDGTLDKLPVFDASGASTGKASPDVIVRAGLLVGGALPLGGNAITNPGLIDGRDVGADGTAQDSHLAAGGTKHTGDQISNGSTVAGASVDDALDTIGGMASFMVPLYDRIMLLPVDVEITESAGNIVCTLTDEAGALFVTGRWASDSHTLVTPATVNLSPGSATVPLLNCVYLTESGGTVTLSNSTTGFPAGSIPIAEVYVQSSTEVAAHGPLGLHIHADDPTEHLRHIGDRIRANSAQWVSGCGATVTISGSSPEDVHVATLVGEAFQFHKHDFPAFNTATGSDVHVVNDSTTPWTKVQNLNTLLTDSAGGSMSGRYFSIVVFGIVNQDTGECKLACNLPGGTYGNSASLDADASKFADYSVPADIRGVSFLIAELHFRHQTAGGGNWTLQETLDLRGLFPAITAGGSAVNPSEFDDSVFRLNDNVDNTKQIAFEASGITTATARTITMPDFDVTLGTIRETAGPTVLTLGAIADGEVLTRSGGTIIGGAGGGGGAQSVEYTRSNSASDYYETASGVCAGADDFIISTIIRSPEGVTTTRDIVQNKSFSGTWTGWSLLWTGTALRFEVMDGGGTPAELAGNPGAWLTANNYEIGRDVHVLFRVYQSGGVINVDMFFNGYLAETAAGANSGMTVGAGAMRIGGTADPLMCAGLGYYEGTLTDAQIYTHVQACLSAADVVAFPVAATNRWSVLGQAGAPGATWSPEEGADNLTETGTMVEESVLARWA